MLLWKSYAPLDLHTCTLSPSDDIVRPQLHACVQFHYTLWSGTACSLDIPFEKSNVPSSERHLDTNLTRSNGTPQRARLGHQQLQPVLEHILSNMSVNEELVACIPLASWIGAPPPPPPPPPPLSTSPTAPHCNTSCTHLYLLVHLVSIDATGIEHEMERAIALKNQGGRWFAREEWTRATSCYKEALRAVLTCKDSLTEAEERSAVLVPAEEEEKEKEDEMKRTDSDNREEKEEKKKETKEETKREEDSITAAAKRVHDLRVKCHLNIASCHMNGNKPRRTISRCNLALDLCPHSIVGLLRRSKAYFSLQMYDDATSDLNAALSVEPGNIKVGKFLRKVAKAKKVAQAAAARSSEHAHTSYNV